MNGVYKICVIFSGFWLRNFISCHATHAFVAVHAVAPIPTGEVTTRVRYFSIPRLSFPSSMALSALVCTDRRSALSVTCNSKRPLVFTTSTALLVAVGIMNITSTVSTFSNASYHPLMLFIASFNLMRVNLHSSSVNVSFLRSVSINTSLHSFSIFPFSRLRSRI